MEHILSPIQEDFIKRAIAVNEAVIQFDISDEDFLQCYGYSKEEVKSEIEHLRNLMS